MFEGGKDGKVWWARGAPEAVVNSTPGDVLERLCDWIAEASPDYVYLNYNAHIKRVELMNDSMHWSGMVHMIELDRIIRYLCDLPYTSFLGEERDWDLIMSSAHGQLRIKDTSRGISRGYCYYVGEEEGYDES